MLYKLKVLFNSYLSIEPGYTECLVCGKKIKNKKNSKYASICDREQCDDENYTCISDLYN